MNIIVKNRQEIDNGFCPPGRSILITITDPIKDWATPHSDYENVFYAKFDDADIQLTPNTVLIDERCTMNILGFVQTKIGEGVENIVVNCEAGLSRSAGVAAALSLIHTGDDNPIIRVKPMYNRYVYRLLVSCHYGGW